MGDGGAGRVLIVGDTLARADARASELAGGGVEAVVAGEVALGCELLRSQRFDVVVADLGSSELGCLAIVRGASRAQPPVRAVCLLPEGVPASRTGSSAIREAAFACLPQGSAAAEVRASVEAALRAQGALASLGTAVEPRQVTVGGGAIEVGRGVPWR